jgi:hypothetical protein
MQMPNVFVPRSSIDFKFSQLDEMNIIEIINAGNLKRKTRWTRLLCCGRQTQKGIAM